MSLAPPCRDVAHNRPTSWPRSPSAHLQHSLAPLLAPRTVALIGASEREGSLGRTVYENLLRGAYTGRVLPVNPNRRDLLGRPVYASLARIGETVDLAVIATPSPAIPGILDKAGGQVRAAVLLSYPEGNDAAAQAWQRDLLAVGRKHGIRFLGPGAFGVVRTDIGLNATFCAPLARPGRLALIAQSGAVCTAMLDFAGPHDIGFSTVVSLGAGWDVGFGELLEALVHDPATDGILLYVESVGDARAFMSALRMAARTKPVVVLKSGRSQEHVAPVDAVGEPSIPPDRVFDAALERAGTRARTHVRATLRRRAHPLPWPHTARRQARDRRQRARAGHAGSGQRPGRRRAPGRAR